MYNDAVQAGFEKESDIAQVWVAYLDYLRRRVAWDQPHEDELNELRTCFSQSEEVVNAMHDRREHLPIILKYWAFIEAKYCGNIQKARELWHMVTRLGHGNQAALWMECVNFEKAFGQSPQDCIHILQSALNAVTDNPEIICSAYINFAREAGTLEQLDDAIVACEKRLTVLKKQEQKKSNSKEKAINKKHPGLGFHSHQHQDRQLENIGEQQGKQQKREGKRKFDQKEKHADAGESPFKKPFAMSKGISNDDSGFKEPKIPPPSNIEAPDAKPVSKAQSTGDNSTTVFLSNLHFQVTEPEIREFFKDVRLFLQTDFSPLIFRFVLVWFY